MLSGKRIHHKMVNKMGKKNNNHSSSIVNKILVPLDGSALAECVLPHARAFAKAFQSDVTFLHVVERDNKDDGSQVDPISWQLRKMEAQTYLNAVARQWVARIAKPNKESKDVDVVNVIETAADAGWESEEEAATPEDPEVEMLEGAAAERIIDYVDEHEDELDLLVISSHGHGGLSKWNLSSVVQKIIYRAFKSFLLIRAFSSDCSKTADATYRRILVPLDGSKRAECVLPFATKLAQAHGAELLLAHVVTRPPMVQHQLLAAEVSELVERLVERNTAEATHYLEQIQARLAPEAEIRLLVSHSPADALLELAETVEADLVVLSAHGYSGENTRPFGSVVTSFISYGDSTLLVIQDLPQDRIRPTRAEVAASKNINNHIGLRKAIAYAQPAFWSY